MQLMFSDVPSRRPGEDRADGEARTSCRNAATREKPDRCAQARGERGDSSCPGSKIDTKNRTAGPRRGAVGGDLLKEGGEDLRISADDVSLQADDHRRRLGVASARRIWITGRFD